MDAGLGADTEKATLEWLAEALEHARARGQKKLVDYLEEVADEVVFEVEATRGRGFQVGAGRLPEDQRRLRLLGPPCC